MKVLTHYIEDIYNPGHYYRYNLDGEKVGSVFLIISWWADIIKVPNKISQNGFGSCSEAMKKLDEMLIKLSYTFLTEDQYDKLKIFV